MRDSASAQRPVPGDQTADDSATFARVLQARSGGSDLVPFQVVCFGRPRPHVREVLGYMAIHRRALAPWSLGESYPEYAARRRLTFGNSPWIRSGDVKWKPPGVWAHEGTFLEFRCRSCKGRSRSERGLRGRLASDRFMEVAYEWVVECGIPVLDMSPAARKHYDEHEVSVHTVPASAACGASKNRRCEECDGLALSLERANEVTGCGCPCHCVH